MGKLEVIVGSGRELTKCCVMCFVSMLYEEGEFVMCGYILFNENHILELLQFYQLARLTRRKEVSFFWWFDLGSIRMRSTLIVGVSYSK